MQSRRGFSRLELVISLLVIVVIIAVFLPQVIHHAQNSTREVCAINRTTILHLFEAHAPFHPGCLLADVLEGSCMEFNEDLSQYVCPGRGHYSAENNERILCDKHDN